MHVLVTGSKGFTGQYVHNSLLEKGHRVTGLESDLLNKAALIDEVRNVQPDSVIHLAGIANVDHGELDEFYQVNLLGSLHLLEAISLHAPKVKKVLLASSANVYGNNEGIMFETTLPSPINDYSVSKLAMEQMARLWFDKLPILIMRPFNYTGVGQSTDFLIPKIVSHFCHKEEVIELGNIEVRRDFGDVRAVASAYTQLLDSGPTGEIVNVCSGHEHSLREVIELCTSLTGHKIQIKVNGDFVRANEVNSLSGSAIKLEALLPAWKMPNLRDTLKWMLEAQYS